MLTGKKRGLVVVAVALAVAALACASAPVPKPEAGPRPVPDARSIAMSQPGGPLDLRPAKPPPDDAGQVWPMSHPGTVPGVMSGAGPH